MTDEMKAAPVVSLKGPEVRTFADFEIRDVDGTDSGSFIEGLAVPYDTWADIGWFMEQHTAGSFAKSIREAANALPLLLFHDDRKFPVGKADRWIEKDDGLHCVWSMDTKDDLAVEGARKAREGYLTGLSIGFAPIQQESALDEDGLMWITRTESRLFEVSLTPTPAFAGAQVSLVRSRVPHSGKGNPARRSARADVWRTYLEGIKR